MFSYNHIQRTHDTGFVFFGCRMSAVAYLASYLSRAKFLSAAMVTTIIQRFQNILSIQCSFMTK